MVSWKMNSVFPKHWFLIMYITKALSLKLALIFTVIPPAQRILLLPWNISGIVTKKVGLTGKNRATQKFIWWKDSISATVKNHTALQKGSAPLILMKTWTSANFPKYKGALRHGSLFIKSEPLSNVQSTTFRSICVSQGGSQATTSPQKWMSFSPVLWANSQ